MGQDIFDWILLLVRWVHITVGVTWIGTSIFFMWLDRSFEKNKNSTRPGHVGELWMVHGGGFYHVEKLEMGPTKAPDHLHWFKWESYWTWMSGFTLISLIFYTGNGTYLLDETVSDISYLTGVGIALFSIFGSWFFYDFLWEQEKTKNEPYIGHIITVVWFVAMTYFLCHTLSGRAAYIHVGAMIGTWMTANVFMRIIPRQVKMVEASKKGEPVNADWGKNAKNRSTHNTYFTLPVIFIMLSNHFPSTYGHEYNWVILILLSLAGAGIREYFISRIKNPKRAYTCAGVGLFVLVSTFSFAGLEFEDHHEVAKKEIIQTNIEGIGSTKKNISDAKEVISETKKIDPIENTGEEIELVDYSNLDLSVTVEGVVNYLGTVTPGKKLRLPKACAKQYSGDVYSNEVLVKNGKLQNALVKITSDILDSSPVQSESVKLDQRGCMYYPRVIGVRVGQPVDFINSDPIFHNVKSVTKKNKRFNEAMPKKDQVITKIFPNAESFMQAKCSVHPWMGAYISVVEHSYFSVTDESGNFQLKNVPAGKHRVEVWHEKFGTIEKEIEVKDSNNITLSFDFK